MDYINIILLNTNSTINIIKYYYLLTSMTLRNYIKDILYTVEDILG